MDRTVASLVHFCDLVIGNKSMLDRHRNFLDVMIKKENGPALKKLRTIELFEADL